MVYKEILEYIYTQIPQFQRVGGDAYKPGLDSTLALSALYGNPHKKLRTIHVAGTNGKGSVSNLIAATLQSAGYKVGLYTSPHLVDFRERIRVDGEMIPESEVEGFMNRFFEMKNDITPSFFELTTIMAFDYFARAEVDVAVIEVGLGGRLDSTNIITPELSIITNISFDHTQFLGNTLPEIAAEKAGIIKQGVPVVIGESNPEYDSVFAAKAAETNSEIVWADKKGNIIMPECQLKGDYQAKNIVTASVAIEMLRKKGVFHIPNTAIVEGFAHVCNITGFIGRWTEISKQPFTVCDAGHNIAGIEYVAGQLARQDYDRLHMVVGFVSDKDITNILKLLPKDAQYYFTRASIPRALNPEELRKRASMENLRGECYQSVAEAYCAAIENARESDMIFIGGSCFVVADFLSYRKTQ